MRVKQTTKTIRKLLSMYRQIDLSPEWQRGPVWSNERRSLLIDSVLRGMDVPKIYLLRRPAGSAFAYEAVDGQQRIRSFHDFVNGEFPLRYEHRLEKIDGFDVNGRTFQTLDRKLAKRFMDFRVNVTEITSATYDQVRQLFLRLQMGVSLNPAELRNAMAGPARDVIDSLAIKHDFFVQCAISSKRYKRQDYLAHAFALVAYNGKIDLKAPNLRAFYEDFRGPRSDDLLTVMADIGDTLDFLALVNQLARKKITQKWIFVDLVWLIYQARKNGIRISPPTIASKYLGFEERRKKFVSAPERLLRSDRSNPRPWDRALYRYIQAFRTSGADRRSLRIRHKALARILDIKGA